MKIAVTSCAKLQQTNPQPVWSEIRQECPDALLLIGDNIYLDHDNHSNAERLRDELRRLYSAQLAEPNFAALLADLRERGKPVFAIYDDHDFLGNNRYGGDNDTALREAARAELVSAFDPPKTGEDIYSAHTVGPVDIVVLDERFYRESPLVSRADRDAILGAKQWTWFENFVNRNEAAPFLLVASSTTFHSFGDESWEQYPGAFDRMRALIGNRPGKMIVSGDVHRNALYDDSGVLEVVTSGVARKGIVFGTPRKNYGILTFDDEKVRVELRSLKSGWRFDVTIERSNWKL